MATTPIRLRRTARRALAAAAVALAAATPATAQLAVPVTTVLGTDVFSGPTFVVPTALAGTATLSLTVSGTVFLQGPASYGTNAAGVVTVAGSVPVGGTSTFTSGSNSYDFGALLLGNATLGFRQLFAANAGNGLGSSAPPTTLSLTDVTLNSLFGSGLAAGTVLEFRIADINTGDNAGSFTLSQSAAVIPEPSSVVLLASGLAGLAVVSRRRRMPSH